MGNKSSRPNNNIQQGNYLGGQMNKNEIVSEVADLNLAYLLLAQRLVREDYATAMFRLGLSREVADLLGSLSLSQVVKLAASNVLLCRFRFDDHAIFSSLTHNDRNQALQQAHASILLAGQKVEEIR
jgi:flagellar transcriptional activator FlhD